MSVRLLSIVKLSILIIIVFVVFAIVGGNIISSFKTRIFRKQASSFSMKTKNPETYWINFCIAIEGEKNEYFDRILAYCSHDDFLVVGCKDHKTAAYIYNQFNSGSASIVNDHNLFRDSQHKFADDDKRNIIALYRTLIEKYTVIESLLRTQKRYDPVLFRYMVDLAPKDIDNITKFN
jgi:hypothetical protein